MLEVESVDSIFEKNELESPLCASRVRMVDADVEGQLNAFWIRSTHRRSAPGHCLPIVGRYVYLTQCKPQPPGAVVLKVKLSRR